MRAHSVDAGSRCRARSGRSEASRAEGEPPAAAAGFGECHRDATASRRPANAPLPRRSSRRAPPVATSRLVRAPVRETQRMASKRGPPSGTRPPSRTAESPSRGERKPARPLATPLVRDDLPLPAILGGRAAAKPAAAARRPGRTIAPGLSDGVCRHAVAADPREAKPDCRHHDARTVLFGQRRRGPIAIPTRGCCRCRAAAGVRPSTSARKAGRAAPSRGTRMTRSARMVVSVRAARGLARAGRCADAFHPDRRTGRARDPGAAPRQLLPSSIPFRAGRGPGWNAGRLSTSRSGGPEWDRDRFFDRPRSARHPGGGARAGRDPGAGSTNGRSREPVRDRPAARRSSGERPAAFASGATDLRSCADRAARSARSARQRRSQPSRGLDLEAGLARGQRPRAQRLEPEQGQGAIVAAATHLALFAALTEHGRSRRG